MFFVTITGIDKSGKTTLIKEFMERTGYINYVVDRDPSTFHFFNTVRLRMMNPKKQIDEYESFQKRFNEIVDLAVLLKVDEQDWYERCRLHKEPDLVGLKDMKDHQTVLAKFFHNANYKNTLIINTSGHTIDECVNLIKEKLKCL